MGLIFAFDMRTLHIFNPETDYALASDGVCYTPPVTMAAIRESLMFMPSLFAEEGDAILLPQIPDNRLHDRRPFEELIQEKRITLVHGRDAGAFLSQYPECRVRPWGWNRALRHTLRRYGVENAYLPSENQIATLRKLAHRRLTIPFIRNSADICNPEIEVPTELTDVQSALDFAEKHGEVYFKAPWSSSGRGLLNTNGLERRHIEPWLKGIIRMQGSVMGEKSYQRKADFATEWECHQGKPLFLGLSTFLTSRRGKYKSNVVMPQDTIASNILADINVRASGNDLSKIIDRQRLLLGSYVAPYYEGPLGIDMLVTEEGNINPCVEINLRDTMGRVAIDINDRLEGDFSSDKEKLYLKALTRGGIFSPMFFLSTLDQMENN